MIERIFTPVLVFVMLAGGTYAVGAEMFAAGSRADGAAIASVRLPKVEVTGRRAAATVRVAGTETEDRPGCATAAPVAESAPATHI